MKKNELLARHFIVFKGREQRKKIMLLI